MFRFVPLVAAPLLLVALIAGACGGDDDGDTDDRLSVVATTAIIGSLAEQIGGEHIDLTVLAKAGVDPHDHELTPGDRAKIEDADVILRHGIGLDEYLDDVIDDSDAVTVTNGVTLIEGEEHEEAEEHEEGDGHSHEGEDPHVWHDPANVKVMVANIAEALADADETNATTYRSNADSVVAELDEIDAEIVGLFENIPQENRKVVTNHDAFGYFFERYGLEFIGAVFPASGDQAEPSAQDIAALTDLIRSEGVEAIFSESSVDPKIADQIAADTGVTIIDNLYGDSLEEPGSGVDTVAGMLRHNARTIAEALQ